MDNQTCGNCAHFILHYVKIKDKYHAIGSGHCIFPRTKPRDEYTPACQNYSDKKLLTFFG